MSASYTRTFLFLDSQATHNRESAILPSFSVKPNTFGEICIFFKFCKKNNRSLDHVTAQQRKRKWTIEPHPLY